VPEYLLQTLIPKVRTQAVPHRGLFKKPFWPTHSEPFFDTYCVEDYHRPGESRQERTLPSYYRAGLPNNRPNALYDSLSSCGDTTNISVISDADGYHSVMLWSANRLPPLRYMPRALSHTGWIRMSEHVGSTRFRCLLLATASVTFSDLSLLRPS
jgi:hypothetical protein